MPITTLISEGIKSTFSYIWPDEPAPDLEKEIVTPKASELSAWEFERIDPAIDPAILRYSTVVLAIFVGAMRLLDQTHQRALENKRDASLDKQHQHLLKMLKAATDKTNKVERWLNAGGTVSMLLPLLGPKAPEFAAKFLESLPDGVKDFLRNHSLLKHVWSITKPETQKVARKQLDKYLPGMAQLPPQYAHTIGQGYEASQQGHSALGQSWQGKADAVSGRKQDDKQNQETLHRTLTGVIETDGQIGQKVVAAAAA